MGFLIHPDIAKCILDINKYLDRIIILKIKRRELSEAYVQLYAPCKDNYTEEQKDEFFFNELYEEIEKMEINGILYVMGDFSGRVDTNRRECKQLLAHMLLRIMTGVRTGKEYWTYAANSIFFYHQHISEHQDSQHYKWYKWNDITIKI